VPKYLREREKRKTATQFWPRPPESPGRQGRFPLFGTSFFPLVGDVVVPPAPVAMYLDDLDEEDYEIAIKVRRREIGGGSQLT